MRKLFLGLAAPLALLASAQALAAAKKPAPQDDYGRNLISVAAAGLNETSAQTADCVVWANAEGLGVGPAQLGGLHGLQMHINLKPLPGEAGPTSFAAGLARLKAEQPGAPAWLVATIEKNRAAIEAACAEDHPEPMKVYSITAKDRG